MTFEEALKTLEIEAQATPEQARRAYLKKVKVHRPEQDPEGFRRVREAYEMVAPVLSLMSSHDWSARSSHEVRPTMDGSDAPVVAYVERSVLRENEGQDEVEDATTAFGKGASDAVEAEAGDDELEWYDAEPEADATPAQVDEWLQHAYPRLLQALERAGESTSAHFPAWSALHALAALVVRGDWNRARTLGRAISNWQAGDAALDERFRGALAARWALLSDLVSVGPGVDTQISSAIGRGIQRDNASVVAIELYRYAESFPERALEALHRTKQKAPYLHSVLAQHIHVNVNEVVDFRKSVNTPKWPIAMGVFALLNLFRLCASHGFSDSDSHTRIELAARGTTPISASVPPPVEQAQISEALPSVAVPMQPGALNFNNIQQAHDMLQALGGSSDVSNLEQLDEAVYRAFETQSCPEVDSAFRALELETRGGGQFVRAEVQRYWAEYLILCPSQRAAGAPWEQP